MTSFGRARFIRPRSQSRPNASTLAHCAAVRRIERCSRASPGGAGGRPRGRFSVSMAASVTHLLNHTNNLTWVIYCDSINTSDKEISMNTPKPTTATNYFGIQPVRAADGSDRKSINDVWLPFSRANKVRGYTSKTQAEQRIDEVARALPGVTLKVFEYSPINF